MVLLRYAIRAPSSGAAPREMPMPETVMTARELLDRIARHCAWLEAGAPDGEPFTEDQLTLFDTRFEHVEIRDTRLTDVSFIRCDLSGSVFRDCNFSGAILTRCDLRRAEFLGCEFRKAELNMSNAREASFAGSGMTRADFSQADLRNVNFDGCDLSWAWFSYTDLRHANLQNVKLDGTRFVETKLFSDARFRLFATERTLVEEVTLDADAAGPAHSGLDALDGIRASAEE